MCCLKSKHPDYYSTTVAPKPITLLATFSPPCLSLFGIPLQRLAVRDTLRQSMRHYMGICYPDYRILQISAPIRTGNGKFECFQSISTT